MSRQNLAFMILLSFLSFTSHHASANSLNKANDWIPSLTGILPSSLQINNSQSYDEAKDPALRKGTENWEQSQESFFVIPGVVIGILGLLLFFYRDKSE